MTLKKKTYSAVRWTALAMVGKGGLQFLQLAILSRLLLPSDFGLMAIVVALLAFLQIFADFGLSSAIIHHQNISREQLSSLYWLNVGSSICLAALVLFAAPWVSVYYSQPKVQPLLEMSAITLVMGAAGQQLRVLAEKQLRFDLLAKLEVAGALFGFLSAVGIALVGGGVYALIGGLMVNTTLLAVMFWIYISDGWRPMMVFQIREIRFLLNFGIYMIANNIVNTISYQVDVLLGAKILGAQSIGTYSLVKEFSIGVSRLFNPIITRVGTPMMAKAQDDDELMKRVYLQTMRMTASVNFPIYVSMGVFAPDVVSLVFGEKWIDAISLLYVFAAWGLFRSTANPVGSLLIARGRADLSFKWNLSLLFVVLPMVWAGSLWGANGLALSSLLFMIAIFIPNWYFLVRPLCGASFCEYIGQFIPPLFASIVAAVIAYAAVYWFEINIVRLTVGLSVGALVYLGLSSLINKDWLVSMQTLLNNKSMVNNLR